MSRPFKKSFLFNLILIGVVCIILYWLFFSSLGWITNHGEEVKVPNFVGLTSTEAISKLEHLGFRIDVDSSYDPTKKADEVLDQQPYAGSNVKIGRTIFLNLNKKNAPTIGMPNLVNLSYRSAEMMLKNNKLLLGDTSFVPDLANGAILKQIYQGKEIAAGTSIPQGSKIDLVIGDGLGSKEFNVPDIEGLTYPEAVAMLNASNLNYTVIFDGVISDTLSSVVYQQAPEAKNTLQENNKITEGDVVDFRVKQVDENSLNSN